MELLSKGIYLEICEEETVSVSSKFKRLYGLSSVPDIGGDPEKVDVTNLADGNRRYISGIVDYGDLEFGFFYNSDDTTSETDILNSYSELRKLQNTGKSIWYRLVYPDNTGHQWKGGVNVKRSAAEVNAALSFTLTTSLETAMEDITITEEEG